MHRVSSGADAWTSGFEGPWTSKPTVFDNEYFKYLLDFEWEVHTGPGDHSQWKTVGQSPVAPGPQGGTQDIMMLTSDVSLKFDKKGEYQKIIAVFAESTEAFGTAFAHAWYKLTTRDMGPVTRCIGDDVPPAEPWQFPLPPRPKELADFKLVAEEIRIVMQTPSAVSVTLMALSPLRLGVAHRAAGVPVRWSQCVGAARGHGAFPV